MSAAIITAAVFLAAFLYGFFLVGLALAVSRTLTAPPRQKQKKTPADYGLAFEPVEWTTPKGYRIRGWVTTPPEPSKGTLVLCHNYKASKQKLLPWICFLSRAAYQTVVFDFNGHGESDRVHTFGGLVTDTLTDLTTVMTQLDRLNLANPSRIGLIGFSMGSVPVLGYLVARTGCPRVNTIVIDSGPPNPLIWNSRIDLVLHPLCKALPGIGLVHWIVRRLQNFKTIPAGVRSIPECVLHSEVPFLFIQGLKDNISAPDESRWLHDHLIRAPKDYWAVPEAHHMTILSLRREEYQQRVLAFLDRHLAALEPAGDPQDACSRSAAI